MALYLPDIYDFKLGTTGVIKIMLGTEQVWPAYKKIGEKIISLVPIRPQYVARRFGYHGYQRLDYIQGIENVSMAGNIRYAGIMEER